MNPADAFLIWPLLAAAVLVGMLFGLYCADVSAWAGWRMYRRSQRLVGELERELDDAYAHANREHWNRVSAERRLAACYGQLTEASVN